MNILYCGYVLTDDNKPFRFELKENRVMNISADGTVETEYPCFYGVIKATNFINGSSDVKTEVEYSVGNSSVYFSTVYDNCMNFLVKKREETYKKYSDMLHYINEFHEKFLNSEIQKDIKDGVKKYSLWQEGYSVTGQSSTAIYLGEFEGTSFYDACDNWAKTLKEPKYYKTGTHKSRPSYWACRIFDNEIDARKSFG